MTLPNLSIVSYRNQTDVIPKAERLTWAALSERLTRHTPGTQKNGPGWSPTSYPDGKTRANENVLTVSCFVLDIDDGARAEIFWDQWQTPEEQPLAFCLHSSYQSTAEKPRWRAVFPLAAPVPADTWPAVHRKLTMALSSGHADPSCKDVSRFYFLPACPPDALPEAFADVREGIPLDPADFPDPPPEETAEAQMRHVFREGPPRAKGEDNSIGGRPGDDFNARADVLDILERHGWQVVREKGGMALLRRPGKVTEYSGTFGYGGTRMFYCFTSSAPPFQAQTGYSPFGVYAELVHKGDYASAARRLRAEGYGEEPRTSGSSPTKADGQGKNQPPETLPETTQPKPQAPRMTAALADGLPMVETNGRHLRDETADALAALVKGNEPPAVFVRGGQLARVQVDENNRAAITGLTPPMLRGNLARCANFISTSEKRGVVPIAPPKDVVEDLLALPEWPAVPPLAGLVTAPVFAADGRLETHPGYHASARLFYHETCPFPIPDTAPTPENIARAKALILDDLLGDFPFADAASRAHAVALLLLPFVRPMISGPTPLHLIDAPAAGTGKGLLAKVCSLPFVPEGATAIAPPTEEAEWSKTLTSVFSKGDSHLLFDNVRHLNSPSFFAAITSTVFGGRLLGTNNTGDFENRLVWLATCNNIQGNDELTRRSVWIRMDAGVERPEAREGFRHADLSEWAKEKRGALIGAALTLAGAWVEAGRPGYAGPERPLGSFEAWTRVMGGILTNAGIEGFLGNRQEQQSRVDTETAAWHGFVEAWFTRYSQGAVVTADLFPLAVEWMPEKLGDGTDRSQKSKFGRLLARHVDKVFAGQKIVPAGKATSGPGKNSPQYRLEAASGQHQGGLGGTWGTFSLPRAVVSREDNIHIGATGVDVSQVSQVPPQWGRVDAEDEELIV